MTDLLPTLSNPATAENIESGYEAIDGSGAVIAGSLNIPFKYVGSFEVQGSLVEFGGASRAIASISSISNLSGKLQKGKRYNKDNECEQNATSWGAKKAYIKMGVFGGASGSGSCDSIK